MLKSLEARSASPVAQTVKNLPAMHKTRVRSPDREDPLEKGIATHSSILVQRIPQRRLVGYSLWGRKESEATEQLTLEAKSEIVPYCQV